MDELEALEVLAVCSAFDEREPSEVQAAVWAEELTAAGISKAEAIEAVRRYYRANPDGRVRPGHLNQYVPLVRREIAARARAAEIEHRRQFMIEQGLGSHDFDDRGDGLCTACQHTEADGPKHPKRRWRAVDGEQKRWRSADAEHILASVRLELPPGSPAFREQLAGKMRDQRPMPGL